MLMRAADQCRLNGAKVVIITKKADNTYAEKTRQMLAAHDIEHYIKNKIPSSFAVIDGKQSGMPAANCSGQQKMNVCCELRMKYWRVNWHIPDNYRIVRMQLEYGK